LPVVRGPWSADADRDDHPTTMDDTSKNDGRRTTDNGQRTTMSKPTVGAGWQRAILTLTGTVVGVVVIGTLYWAQSVFIPVALAGFLTFLLSPLVNRLRQLGLPRTPSVIVTVLFSAALLGGVGWVVTDQISSLLQELPKYRQTVKEKVRTIKQ